MSVLTMPTFFKAALSLVLQFALFHSAVLAQDCPPSRPSDFSLCDFDSIFSDNKCNYELSSCCEGQCAYVDCRCIGGLFACSELSVPCPSLCPTTPQTGSCDFDPFFECNYGGPLACDSLPSPLPFDTSCSCKNNEWSCKTVTCDDFLSPSSPSANSPSVAAPVSPIPLTPMPLFTFSPDFGFLNPATIPPVPVPLLTPPPSSLSPSTAASPNNPKECPETPPFGQDCSIDPTIPCEYDPFSCPGSTQVVYITNCQCDETIGEYLCSVKDILCPAPATEAPVTNTSTEAPSPPPGPTCPAEQPRDGDACDASVGLCEYDDLCCQDNCVPRYSCKCSNGNFRCDENYINCPAVCPTTKPEIQEECMIDYQFNCVYEQGKCPGDPDAYATVCYCSEDAFVCEDFCKIVVLDNCPAEANYDRPACSFDERLRCDYGEYCCPGQVNCGIPNEVCYCINGALDCSLNFVSCPDKCPSTFPEGQECSIDPRISCDYGACPGDEATPETSCFCTVTSEGTPATFLCGDTCEEQAAPAEFPSVSSPVSSILPSAPAAPAATSAPVTSTSVAPAHDTAAPATGVPVSGVPVSVAPESTSIPDTFAPQTVLPTPSDTSAPDTFSPGGAPSVTRTASTSMGLSGFNVITIFFGVIVLVLNL